MRAHRAGEIADAGLVMPQQGSNIACSVPRQEKTKDLGRCDPSRGQVTVEGHGMPLNGNTGFGNTVSEGIFGFHSD